MDDKPDLGRTRQQTRSSHLQPPVHRSHGRAVSRSPSPSVVGGNQFRFPPDAVINHNDSVEQYEDATAMPIPGEIDVAELQRIALAASEAAAKATEALAAMSTQLAASNAQLSKVKKPELPDFDAQNIEIWIRRVESAFTRAGVRLTKDKFAFLEPKLDVKLHPRINEFLFEDFDDDPWEDFLSFLREEYGRTLQQRTATLIDGIRREGRRPSQLAAVLCDRTRDVTVDDVRREQLLRELPNEIRRAIAKESVGLSLKETAALADHYFDRDGRVLYATPSSSINAVKPSSRAPDNKPSTEPQSSSAAVSFTGAFEDPNNSEINAVQQSRQRPSQQSGSAPRSRKARSSSRPSRASNAPTAQRSEDRPARAPIDEKGNCFYHSRFGNKANKCEPGCRHPQAGNFQAGRRM